MSDSLEELLAASRKPAEFILSAFGDEIASDLDEQLKVLEEEGIRFIELRSAWGKNVADFSDEDLKQIEMLLATHSIGVSAIGSPIGKVPITAPFEPELQRFERILEIADWLGSSYIRLFSFFMPEEEGEGAYARYRGEVIRRLERFAELAQPYGLILLHENEKGIYGDTAERCANILDSVGSSNLRAVFDPANFVQCGVKPFSEAYPLLENHVTYLHVKDAFFADGRVVVAGEGEGEVEQVLAALNQKGYAGFVSLEPHLSAAGRYGGFSGPQLFHEAVNALKGVLEKIGANPS
ncbi:MAG TPA: sugar phosphate isomerase/epimerase family protein [Chloroflexia bacterium]|nr:sugar phosphate isomerase/epimerase family protein [Chloroflexia bacterium]